MTMLAPARARALHAQDLSLSEVDFNRIADFTNREFGIHLPPGKKDLVHNRLMALLRRFELPNIAMLCARLEAAPQGAERTALISALTTNVTNFFREAHHFDIFAERVLKPQREALRRGARLRIWSAGCSAGQEPASIAMTILEHLPEVERGDIRILATDIDAAILARARAGCYPVEERDSIPTRLQARMLEPTDAGQFRLNSRLSAMIHLAELNLMQAWPMRGPFDAIFCRNVAIYFDKPTQARLWSRFAEILRPGGYLFIGHSERITGPACSQLISAGITSYRRMERTQHEPER